jgi:hypothetical protein
VKDEEKVTEGKKNFDFEHRCEWEWYIFLKPIGPQMIVLMRVFSADPHGDAANEAEGDVDAVGDESMLANVTIHGCARMARGRCELVVVVLPDEAVSLATA